MEKYTFSLCHLSVRMLSIMAFSGIWLDSMTAIPIQEHSFY